MSVSTLSPSKTVARPRASLAVAMLGFFVVALDAQIVNVALPEIRNDLGGGLSGLQWIVTGYTLMFSALQLFSGTFSDRAGARRAYGLGMILFTVASAGVRVQPESAGPHRRPHPAGHRRGDDHPQLSGAHPGGIP